jgi:hypothetical protein
MSVPCQRYDQPSAANSEYHFRAPVPSVKQQCEFRLEVEKLLATRHFFAPSAAPAAAPEAWHSQTAAGMAIAQHACYQKNAPLTSPALEYAPGLLSLILAGAALIALCAVVASVIAWSRTRRESRGNGHMLVEIGEGRTRFLAMCAMILSIGFSIAIGFSAVGLNVITLC